MGASLVRQHRFVKALTAHHVLAAAAYLGLGLLILPHYQYFMYKDEISYVAAAERYARGDLVNAPNAYWGPLISWLLAPLLMLGLPAVLASRLLSLGIGAATFFAARRLADLFDLPRYLRVFFFLLLIPYLLYFALPFISADLLLTCLLLFYFSIVLDRHYPELSSAGVLSGALGALAYFAKGYALPFFIVHFSLCNIIQYRATSEKGARRRVLRHFVTGMGVLALLASGWVAVLYHKYNEVTVGVTGKYNYQIVGPEAAGRPTVHIGFTRPPDSTSVSIWEDPYYLYGLPEARTCCLKAWSPLDSWAAFKHQVRLVKQNVSRTISIYQRFSVLSLTVIFTSLIACFTPRVLIPRERLPLVLGLVTLTVYPAAYTLIYSDERYLWPMLLMIILLGFFMLHLLFQTRHILFQTRRLQAVLWQAAILVLFVGSFSLMPSVQLFRHADAGKTTGTFAQLLEGEHLSGARIASNTDYRGAVCVIYHIKAKYYGQSRPNSSDEDIVKELRQKGVQYYFVWDTPSAHRPGLQLVRELKAGDRSLAIYAVQPRG